MSRENIQRLLNIRPTRYNCTMDERYPFNSTEEFRYVCDELIPEGLRRYYERQIYLGTELYEVSFSLDLKCLRPLSK